MNRFTKITMCVAAGMVPIVMYPYPTGAPPRRTGAPGDMNCISSGCHSGTLIPSSTAISVTFPNGATYTPGVKQRLTITANDSFALRYGFELAARLNSNLSGGQAGTLAPADATVAHLECDGDPNIPSDATTCPAVEFVTHSTPNPAPSTANTPATWQVDWTPPATNAGGVTLYLAVNASNETGPQNKHIHLASFPVTVAAATGGCPTTSTTPVVCGVANGASFASAIAPGGWFTIGGLDLSTTSPGRTWATGDFTNGGEGLPLALDGTSVTVNGRPAYVEFISPTQVNAVAAADTTAAGQQVPVVVSLNGTPSASFLATYNAVAPAFFEELPPTADAGKYLIAQHASNFGRVGKTGLYPSDPSLTTPAVAGETVIFYGSGFGPTTPGAPDGQLTPGTGSLLNLTTPPTITVGGLPATVSFAGLAPNFAALYQFNVTLPANVPSGDQPVVATLADGTTMTQSELITIQ